MVKYLILANPIAGRLSVKRKRKKLDRLVDRLGDAKHKGLDINCVEGFNQLIEDVSNYQEHLIVAGGDGTMHFLFQRINTKNHKFSFVPMGTGNALKYALSIPGSIDGIANQILEGSEQDMDLIYHHQTGEKAFLASVGIDGYILQAKDAFAHFRGGGRFLGSSQIDYTVGIAKAVFGGYRRVNASMKVDGAGRDVEYPTSIVITKIPFYGMGLEIAPHTQMDDGQLAITTLDGGILRRLGYVGRTAQSLGVVATSFFGGNLCGTKEKAYQAHIETVKETHLQLDGEYKGTDREFTFDVIPDAVKWVA